MISLNLKAIILCFSIFVYTLLSHAQISYAQTNGLNEAHSLSNLWSLAEQNNPALKAGRASKEKHQHLLSSSTSAFWPHLFLESEYNNNQEKIPQTQYSTYLSARLNIFNGFQDQKAMKIASLEKSVSQLEYQNLKNQLWKDLLSLYSEFSFLHFKIEVIKRDIQEKNKQTKMAKTKVRSGLTTQTDVLELNLHQQNRELEVLNINNQITNLNEKIRIIVGIDERVKVKPSQVNIKPVSILLKELNREQITSSNNITERIVMAEQKKAELNLQQIRGQWMPQINTEARFGRLGDTDFKSARNDSWSLMAQISMPLFEGFKTTNQYRSQRAEALIQEYKLHQVIQSQSARMNQIFDSLTAIETRLKILEAKKETTKKFYAATLSEYRRGVKGLGDLGRATDEMFGTEIEMLSTKNDYVKICTELEFLIDKQGTCLKSNGLP
jgi:outer membrane protein